MNTYLSTRQKRCSTKPTFFNNSLSYLIKTTLLLFMFLGNLSVFGQTTYRSASATLSDWHNPNTWTPNGVPGANDYVEIRGGHTIEVNDNASCMSITFTTTTSSYYWNLAVNNGKTLDVSGAITLNYTTTRNNINANITGQGTINCGSIVLGNGSANFDAGLFDPTYVCTLKSSIDSINVSNDIEINSYRVRIYGRERIRNGVFEHDRGKIVVDGSIKTINVHSYNESKFLLGTGSPHLILKGINSFDLSTIGTSTIVLNTLNSTVEYKRAGDQSIYVTDYYNLISSTSGIKTLEGNIGVWNLTINGTSNLTTGYPITGNSTGRLEMNNTSTLTLSSTTSTVPFPYNFTSYNIIFSPGTTVVYQGIGGQTVSSVPNSYKNLHIQGGGTKNTGGNIRVDESLVLNGACLATGSGADIILGKDAAISAAGAFSSSQMIVCNGTGSLVKEGVQSSDFVMEYPIGAGNAYTPLEVTSLSATVNGTGSFYARTLNERGSFTNPNDLNRHWTTSSNNLSNISANIKFFYNSNDVLGDEDKYKPMFLNGVTWTAVSNGFVDIYNDFFTVSNVINIDVQWTLREPITTYYSYQSGDWKNSTTWTTDPSGSVWEGGGVPSTYDRVVILNGRTVTINEDSKVAYSLQLNEGGELDIGTTTGHNFNVVVGQGTIKLASTTFPTGDFDSFVAAGGGTVEYYNSSNFTFDRKVYNNLIINLPNLSTATINDNMTINGNFTIKQGTFQISASGNRTLSVKENVTVETSGKIEVGNVTGVHDFIISGDFVNYGQVKFSLLSQPDYTGSNNRHVDVYFDNATKDQYVKCNGVTEFYRIVVNKGIDQTYILNIDASSTSNFKLFGRNNLDATGYPPNITNRKALDILVGTLRLGNNIVIPSLCGTNLVYYIDEDAMLWLDGATVDFSNSTTGDGSTFLLYGGYKQTGNSNFLDNSKQGFVVRITGQIFIEGGNLSTEIIRTSYQPGTHRGSFTMSGGVVNLRGSGLPNLDGMSVYGTFTMPYATNAINISGGTINILAPNPTGYGYWPNYGGRYFSVLIGADPNNVNITGGTVNIHVTGSSNSYINSTMPFWDLNIISSSSTFSAQPKGYPGNSTTYIPAMSAQPLVVLNNLTLENQAVLNSGESSVDVIVGKDFIINSGTTYTPLTNNTIFNGSGVQTFSNSGTITSGLYKMSIINGSELNLAGTASIFNVRNDFEIGTESALRDNTKIVNVAGNIINSGTHIRPSGAAGRIVLNGTGNQDISGDGNGKFNNLAVNKTGGELTVSSDIQINGAFSLVSNIRVNLGSNRLILGENAAVYSALGTGAIFNNNKMILTNGFGSDRGITKLFSGSGSEIILLPYGFYVSDNSTYYYMPSTIEYSGAVEGTVTSRPVKEHHPLAQNLSLSTYWKNTTTGFEGVSSNAFRLRFTYNDYFISGIEANYVAAVYRHGDSWIYLNDPTAINTATNTITFANQPTANGDHTAGYIEAFGSIPVLYSRENGDWDSTSTWSETGHDGVPASQIPNETTLVIIGEGHTVQINSNGKRAGGLRLLAGTTLDITNTTGHDFSSIPEEKIDGAGTLKISSSNYFPAGDFGDFLGPNGGTVEYYTNNADIVIPIESDDAARLKLNQYRNLVLRIGTNHNIQLPSLEKLTILENILCTGNSYGNSSINISGTNKMELVVKGDFIIDNPTFVVNNTQKDIIVYGDLMLTTNRARFTVSATSADNRLHIYGDIINDGTLGLNNATGGSMEAIFKGVQNTVIDGTGQYFFYRIIVDKGTNRNAVVTLLAPITVAQANPLLELKNGTFRVNRAEADLVITYRNTDFTIPHTAALSVVDGNVRIATSTVSGSGKLCLAGRLEVLGGKMFIGNSMYNTNHSIEYVAAGNPEIIVEDGELHVNGQIRRLTAVTTGNLHYRQSGGTTTIYGKSRIATRGLFEIDNLGSFEMSGGTLQFDRPSVAGTTFGDVVLKPDSLSVTGGMIKFGLPTSIANYNFKMIASSPVWDLTVGNEIIPQLLTTNVYAITVKGELLINEASQFIANGLNVTLKGNIVNKNTSASTNLTEGGYQPGTNTQTTIFSGNIQNITGTENNLTNFANLVIEPTSSVSLLENTTVRVNNTLEIRSGTLIDGGNFVYAAGDIVNTSIHVSSQSSGGINLVGMKNQKLRGYGATYGNIIIDNSHGISLLDNTTINGRLILENGLLYIDDYLLTLGVNATVEGAFDNSKMIMLNGVLSDLGVRKMFSSVTSSQFTIPIGTGGKYTPATYTVTTGTPGAITVRPVNREHPALYDVAGNELQYYWSVNATGFGTDLQLTHKYQYIEEDVLGTIDQYVVGLYHYDTYLWNNLGNDGHPGKVNAVEKTIEVLNVNYATGDFTAGYPANFISLPTYYSRNNRLNDNWIEQDNWSTVGHDDDTHLASVPPHGNPIVIAAGHTMVISVNQQMQASVEVNGVLNCGKTVFHNLGNVYGTGKIVIESTDEGYFVFPAGEYEEFFNTMGTEVELTGSITATMPLKPGNYSKPFNNLILSGLGQKNMSADDLRVRGRLEIKNGTKLNSSNHNRSIYISGDWINENTTENSFIAGTGTVFIEGTETQNMTVSAKEKFNNLTMQNSAGLVITNNPIEIMKTLRLTKGVIHSAENREVILSNTSISQAVVGVKNTSFVDGPVKKRILSGQSFNFPTGNDGRLGVIRLTRATSSQQYWTAQYFNTDPSPTYPTEITNLAIPLTAVSDNEYWRVIGPDVNSEANIYLRYDGVSFPEYTYSSSGRNLLRVVENEADMWTPIGDRVSGTATSGNVYTFVPQSVTQVGHTYSIGAIGVTAIIDDTTSWSICDNETDYVMVPVKLTGNPPYRLTYKTVGEYTREFTENNIETSQFVITLNGLSMGGYSATPYVLKLVSVSGDGGATAGFVRPDSVKITVKLTHKPIISGAAIVALGEERTYTTPLHDGSVYLWEWVGASGGTITPTANEAKINFNSTTGVYVLKVTETSSSGCFAYDEITINVQNMPAPYINPHDETNICQGEIRTYTTNYNPSNEYFWTVVGGVCQGCDSWVSDKAQIIVTWDSPTNAGYVKVEEQIKNTTTKSEDILNIQVSKQPTQRTLLGDEVCQNLAGQITVINSESGVNYQLVNNSSGINVGPYLSGNGGNLQLNTDPLLATENFYVRAYNLGCELRMPPNPGTVDVTVQNPDVQLAIDDTDHILCQGTQANFTASDAAALANSFNFIINGLSVQSSESTSYATTSLQHNDEIYVVGTTNKGCRDTSSVIAVSVGNNIWSGEVSTAWESLGNWACGYLPSLAIDAFIPVRAARMPIVSTSSFVKTIEVETGASLTHNNGIFSIAGDIINRGTFTSSNATIRLTGGNEQKLIDNTGFNFSNLTVEKQGESVILETKVNISGALTLTSGIVKTDDTNILTLANTASTTPGNANSYVDGPMQKIGNTDFTFPVGAGDRWARIGISDIVAAKSTITMKAQYHIGKYSEPDNVSVPLNNASEVEHWYLQNTTNDAECNVTLHTENVSLSNINTSNLPDLRVAYFDGTWTDKGNGGTSFDTNTGSIKSGVSTTRPNNYFTFGSLTGDNPLPVELINFKAYLYNGQTLLTWITATEHNNSHFEIERSDNMKDFTKIGTVYSKAQNGSSTQAIDYAYTDDAPKAGTNYYRLKQVDFNGMYSYSKVVSVTSDRENDPLESVMVYPNPTTGSANIIVLGGDENIHISLYSYNGVLLLEYKYNSSDPTIDLSQYASGLYMLKISKNGKHIVQRVIKQ